MGALLAWFTTVVTLLAGVVAFHHLGLNLDAWIGATVRGLEHLLGSPL